MNQDMKFSWKLCARIGTGIFLLYLCTIYWKPFTKLFGTIIGAAAPLLIGCAVAYILNILMSFYEKHYFPKTQSRRLIKSRRPVCMAASFLTLLLIIVFLINMVVPELVSCVELMVRQIPDTVHSFVAWLETKNIVPRDVLEPLGSIDWRSKIEQIIKLLTSGIGNVMGTAIGAVSLIFSGAVTALFSFIFSIYLLSGKEKLSGQFRRVMARYMHKKVYERILYIIGVLHGCFTKYIVGQCVEAVILGTLCTVGMLLLRIPYATMTGTVIAFTALIPVAGAYIGAAVGAVMILTVSPVKALIFVVFLMILQQLEGSLIYPRVVGSSLGLPSIWVLAAVTIGGGVMGVFGMLLGVPLAAAAYRLLREDVEKKEAKEKAKDKDKK